MKRFFSIVCALSMLTFVACSDDGNGGGDTSEIVVPPTQQENLSQEIGASTTEGSGVTFTTAGAWTSAIKSVRSGETDWISITPDHGDAAGTYTISITLIPNETGEERRAEIIITCGDTKIVITIVQSATDEPSQGGDEWTGFPVVPQNDRIAMIYKEYEVDGMSGTGCSYEKFEYDEQGRISKYTVGGQEPEGVAHSNIYSYVYSADKIEIYAEYVTGTTNESEGLVQTAYLNDKGLVDRDVNNDSYTATYTYTNAGRLITMNNNTSGVVCGVEWSDEGAEISIANEIVGNLTWGTQFGWSGVDLSVSTVIGGGLGYWVVGGADAYNPVAITGLCGTFYDRMPATVNIDDLNGDGRTITGFDNFKYDAAARIIGFDRKLSTGGSDEIKIYYADNELPDVGVPGDEPSQGGDEPSQDGNVVKFSSFPGPKIKALKQYRLTDDGELGELTSTRSFKYEDSRGLLTEVTQRWGDGEYDYEKYTFTYPTGTDTKLVMKCDEWYDSGSNYEYSGYDCIMTLNEKGYAVDAYNTDDEDEVYGVTTIEYDEDILVRLNYGDCGYTEYRWDTWTLVYEKYDEMGDGQYVREHTFTPSSLYSNPFWYSQVDPTVMCEEEVGFLEPWAFGLAGGHNQALYESISSDDGSTTIISFEYEFEGEQIVNGNTVPLISRVTTSYTFSDGGSYRECYLFEYYTE